MAYLSSLLAVTFGMSRYGPNIGNSGLWSVRRIRGPPCIEIPVVPSYAKNIAVAYFWMWEYRSSAALSVLDANGAVWTRRVLLVLKWLLAVGDTSAVKTTVASGLKWASTCSETKQFFFSKCFIVFCRPAKFNSSYNWFNIVDAFDTKFR